MKNLNNLIYLFKRSWKISKSLLIITAVKSLFFGLRPLVNIAGLGIIINNLVIKKPLNEMILYVFLFVGINLIIGLIEDILNLFEIKMQCKTSNIMQNDYMKDSMNINYHYVQDKTIIDLKKKSMNAHPAFFLKDIGKISSYIVQFIGIIFIFSLLSPYFLIVLLVFSTLIILFTALKKRDEFKFKSSFIEDEQRLDYIFDVSTNYKYGKEIRINNVKTLLNEKCKNIFRKMATKLERFYKKIYLIDTLNTIFATIQIFLIYFYFSYLAFNRKITIAEYTVLLGTTTLFASILVNFFDAILNIGQTIKYTDLYREYENDIKAKSDINLNSDKNIKIDFENFVIKFENVTFMYPDTKTEVLKNINFEIKKGDKIGLVGLNGSGKTTLIKLLMRLYNPTKGKILLNNIDIKNIPLKEYTNFLTVVLQDFHLFAYTIKENIILQNDFDEERFKFCIEESGLKDFINSLEKCEDTHLYKEVEENGVELSGGNAQRLAIARAIYKNANLLIFDEPTSSLDPLTEYEMFWKLYNLTKNKTAILISHRLSSTKFCDRIIVLDKGKIVETGSHKNLMQKRGLYNELFTLQADKYLKGNA